MPALTHTIISNGTQLSAAYHVVGIDVVKEVNRIPNAELSFIDGSLPEQTFALSEGDFFNLGNEIEIKLRYEGSEDSTLFKGLVVRQSIEASQHGSLLAVTLKDAAVKATQLRNSVVHKDLSDADIISALIEAHGLEKGTIDSTEPTHPEIIQYNSVDWDFLVMRAESQGLLVTVDDGTVSAQSISLDSEPSHQFEYGLSQIHSFEFKADASHNFKNIKTQTWDIANQELTDIEASAELSLQQGDFDVAQLAQTFETEDKALIEPVPLAAEEAQAWVDSQRIRNRLARFKGRLTVPGMGDIKLLQMVEIAGMGDRFNGKALVTGIRHRVTVSEGWLTDIQLGLADEVFAAKPDISDVPAAGLLPAAKTLLIGVVAGFEEDPSAELRIKVLLPGVGAEADAIWARLASPDAGNGRGFFFRPEVGDEVVVGFFNNDPRQAIILGSMYSSANPPLEDWSVLDEDNFNKGIVTRTGTKIEFIDEEKPKLRIETAAANAILLDDDGESVEISDQHGNTIIMNADGITITSSSDFIVEASGNVEIAGSAVDIK